MTVVPYLAVFVLAITLFAAIVAMLGYSKARTTERNLEQTIVIVGKLHSLINSHRFELKSDISRLERTVNEWREMRISSDGGRKSEDES